MQEGFPMQQINLTPMTPSPQAAAARRRDERLVLVLIASLLLGWVVVGCGCALVEMQRAAELSEV
jgi:hypothetical protein